MSDKDVLIILATISALLFAYRKQWESVFTRAVLAISYYLAVTDVIEDSKSAMFLIRWSILLLLFVEILFSVALTAFRRTK